MLIGALDNLGQDAALSPESTKLRKRKTEAKSAEAKASTCVMELTAKYQASIKEVKVEIREFEGGSDTENKEELEGRRKRLKKLQMQLRKAEDSYDESSSE